MDKNKKILYLILLTLTILNGILFYQIVKLKKENKKSDEIIQDYLDDKISNTNDLNNISNTRKVITIYNTKHIEKVRVIQKNLEDEKNYIESINDNNILRSIGTEYTYRYNMRK